jgi:hypothetical protein
MPWTGSLGLHGLLRADLFDKINIVGLIDGFDHTVAGFRNHVSGWSLASLLEICSHRSGTLVVDDCVHHALGFGLYPKAGHRQSGRKKDA